MSSKSIRLNTKLTAYSDGLELKDSCTLLIFPKQMGPVKKTILRIYSGEYTGKQWEYYLETLWNIGIIESSEVSDRLVLDFGINLMVTGMKEVYREIINYIIWE